MESQPNKQLNIQELFEISADINSSPSLPNYIISLFEQCVIDSKLCHLVVSAIINLVPQNQADGLFYFKHLLTCISSEESIENLNITFWLNSCISPAKTDENQYTRYEILLLLIEKFHANNEFSKLFISSYIQKFFERNLTFCINDENRSRCILKCVEVLLIKYPGSCKPYRKKIEDVSLKYLALTDPAVDTLQAAKCFHYLQQVGGGKMIGDNDFLKSQLRLCSSISKLYDLLFEPFPELNRFNESNEEPFPICDEITDETNDNKKIINITFLLTKCFKYLEMMCLEKFPLAKNFSVDEILNIIRRGLEIQTNSLDETYSTCKMELFNSCLITIQISLIHLLRCLVLCLGVHTLPFENVITRLVSIIFKYTKTSTHRKLSCDLRISTYKFLSDWVAIIKNGIEEQFFNEFVSEILNDIVSDKSEVTLMVANKGKKNGSTSLLQLREESTKIKSTFKENLCKAALSTLNVIFVQINIKMEEKVKEKLYLTILKTLLHIQSGQTMYPYTNEKCQLELYRLLYSMMQHSEATVQLPLNIVAHLFTEGIKHPNAAVAEVCVHACNNLQKLCQPMFPSLNVTFEMKTTDDSRFNRTESKEVLRNSTMPTDPLDESEIPEITISNVMSLSETQEEHFQQELIRDESPSPIQNSQGDSQISASDIYCEPPFKKMCKVEIVSINTTDDEEVAELLSSFNDQTN